MRATRLALGLALLCAPAPCFAQDVAKPAEGHLRIGTWNIENFGARGGRGKQPRTEADFAAIAKLIQSLHVDVLALQEINGAEPLAKLTAHMPGYQYVVGTSGKIGCWHDDAHRAVCDGKARRHGCCKRKVRQIAVGFLWNAQRVELLRASELRFPRKDPNGVSVFHRQPVLGVFKDKRTGYDFRAVAVHFKAGRIKGREEDRRTKKNILKRSVETKILGETMKELLAGTNEDQDLVIMGDFNHDPTYPAYKVLDAYVDYLRPTAAQKGEQTIIYFEEQIDHITVTEGMKGEVVSGSFRIHNAKFKANAETWQRVYSDHIPVTVDVNAGTDDDDGPFTKAEVEGDLTANTKNQPAPPAWRKWF